MKSKLLVLLLMLSGTLCAQPPVIDSTHMPAPGTIITRTLITDLSAVDYTLTGSDYLWNFSMLDGGTYLTDTFVAVSSAPFTYVATFSNPFDKEHKATTAKRQSVGQSLPGISINDMYNFYKSAYSYYGQVGFGAEVNGLPIPVKYDHADTIYKYPFIFGDTYSSTSQYEISIPSLGYHSERKFRVNYVDGYGTIIVPGDTFNVVRLRSELQIFDSLYIDSLGFGFGIDRAQTEYKWISPESKLPVFEVTISESGMGGSIEQAWFLDRRDHSATPEFSGSTIHIYPNPVTTELIVSGLADTPTSWEVFDLNGRCCLQGASITGSIDTSTLPAGEYLLSIRTCSIHRTIKFIRN